MLFAMKNLFRSMHFMRPNKANFIMIEMATQFFFSDALSVVNRYLRLFTVGGRATLSLRITGTGNTLL